MSKANPSTVAVRKTRSAQAAVKPLNPAWVSLIAGSSSPRRVT